MLLTTDPASLPAEYVGVLISGYRDRPGTEYERAAAHTRECHQPLRPDLISYTHGMTQADWNSHPEWTHHGCYCLR